MTRTPACRTRHWRCQPSTFGRAPPAVAVGCRRGRAVPAADAGRSIGERHDHDQLQDREADHGPAPAEHRDRALEDGRPDEAGEIAAARDQRQRRAAASVEPAADIDEQRRVHSGVAEQPHEQAVADIELPRRAQRRQHKTERDHRRADDHGPADAVAVGDPAHQDAADAGAEECQRHRERRHLPCAAGVGGDLLQADRGDPRPAERQAEQDQRNAGDHPGRARLDRTRRDCARTKGCDLAACVEDFCRHTRSRRIGMKSPAKGQSGGLGPGEFEVLLCTKRQGGNEMIKTMIAIALAAVGADLLRKRAILSVASGHSPGSARRRRIDRHHRAHHRRGHAAASRPAGDRRELARRRRHHRRDPRRALGAGRLHSCRSASGAPMWRAARCTICRSISSRTSNRLR